MNNGITLQITSLFFKKLNMPINERVSNKSSNSNLIYYMPSHDVTSLVPFLFIEWFVDFSYFRAKHLHLYEVKVKMSPDRIIHNSIVC